MSLGKFEGEEVLLGKVNIGAVRFTTDQAFHKGEELLIVLRVQVDEVAFPPGDTAVRMHRSKVVRRKIGKETTTAMAAIVSDDDKARLAQWLSDAVDAREGRARLQADEGPDWLRENPEQPLVERQSVEMGDGPATAKRGRKARQSAPDGESAVGVVPDEAGPPSADEVATEGVYVDPGSREAADSVREMLGEPKMSDEEWEMSARGV